MPEGPTAEEFDILIAGIIKYRDKVGDLIDSLIEIDPATLPPTTLMAIISVMAADQEIITEGRRIRTKYNIEE